MKFPFIKQPKSGMPDVMVTLSVVAVFAAVLKFLLEGVTIVVYGHSIDFGHADSLTYGALLAPVLGAHGWVDTMSKNPPPPPSNYVKVDNPDVK